MPRDHNASHHPTALKRLLRGCALAAGLMLLAGTGLAHEGHGEQGGMAGHGKNALATGVGAAPDGRLWIVGVDGDGRLFTRHSADLGRRWSAPTIIDVGGDKISADGENHPKIAFGPDGRAVISYTQPLAKPYTGEIRMVRSVDGGQTFSAPFTVHADRQLITHRFESIAFDRQGTLHTVWIDKRDQVLAGKGEYAGAAIYRNESHDGGASFGPDTKLADHSCECCRIALAPTPDGHVAALWRHVFAPNIRDHAFAILDGEATTPVRASEDDWKIDACPHHGPGLSPAAGGGYHAVWFGERNGRAAVRYGRLAADGTPAGAVREIPDPQAEHADVAALGKRVVVVWRSFDGRGSHLVAWRSDDDGAHFRLRNLATSKDDNDHPRLIATPQGIRVVWRTTRALHVFDPLS
ncbi:MAG: exo-alpha-sialidase [Rhodocyclaceae bacterium]|nr:MAG: exo-alpha-sialidase [Rhodocyclaceae bacterium]